MAARYDVRVDRALHHREALANVDLPKSLVPFGKGVTAPDVVDEDVELAVIGAHCV